MIPIARQIQRLRSLLAVVLVGAGGCVHPQPGTELTADDPWREAPVILARIVPPRFPDRDFAVTDFGAKGDGVTIGTQAFRDAIAACAKAGGGRVIVPAGKFLTAAIHLRSGVNLHLAENAEIIFSDN